MAWWGCFVYRVVFEVTREERPPTYMLKLKRVRVIERGTKEVNEKLNGLSDQLLI